MKLMAGPEVSTFHLAATVTRSSNALMVSIRKLQEGDSGEDLMTLLRAASTFCADKSIAVKFDFGNEPVSASTIACGIARNVGLSARNISVVGSKNLHGQLQLLKAGSSFSVGIDPSPLDLPTDEMQHQLIRHIQAALDPRDIMEVSSFSRRLPGPTPAAPKLIDVVSFPATNCMKISCRDFSENAPALELLEPIAAVLAQALPTADPGSTILIDMRDVKFGSAQLLGALHSMIKIIDESGRKVEIYTEPESSFARDFSLKHLLKEAV